MPIFRRRAPRAPADLSGLSRNELQRLYASISPDIEADADPDARGALNERVLVEALGRLPEAPQLWYDRGMWAKWRRDWEASRAYNLEALDLLEASGTEGEPAAWNLGIAATALRDWPTARRAWVAFGLPLDGPPDEPVAADFGLAPVRLNAVPRFVGERLPLIDGRTWETEVVWGRRLCPARIRIENVPLPESGHRFGDVVLHDGDTLGARVLDGREVGVFNEIDLWERSPLPTLTADVSAPDEAAVVELTGLFEDAGAAAEDWTGSVRVLCRACSEGTPGHTHQDHGHGDGGWRPARSVGLAGEPAAARLLLERWAAAGPERRWSEPEVALP